jgi:hypothetical protein
MYRDRVQWAKIRRRILVDGVPIRRVVRETGISRKTIRKMLIYPLPKPYGLRSCQEKQPFPLFISAKRPVKVHATPNKRDETKEVAFEWMRSVLQKQLPLDPLQHNVGDLCEADQLTAKLYDGRLWTATDQWSYLRPITASATT